MYYSNIYDSPYLPPLRGLAVWDTLRFWFYQEPRQYSQSEVRKNGNAREAKGGMIFARIVVCPYNEGQHCLRYTDSYNDTW